MDPGISDFRQKKRFFVTLRSAGERPGADPAPHDPPKHPIGILFLISDRFGMDFGLIWGRFGGRFRLVFGPISG